MFLFTIYCVVKKSETIEVEAVVSPSLEMPASDENSLNDFIETVKSLLSSSKGEMIIADYEVNRYNLRDELNGFIAKARIPATTLNMGKSAINESSPYYVGVYVGKISDKAVTEAAMNSDIALVIGAKFTDGTTCFTDANPEIKYIHIHPFYCEAEGKIYDNIYMWNDGRKYIGEYVDDKNEGQEIFTWPDGKIYDGEWKTGKQDGVGTFTSKSGETRQGLWQEGKRIRWITNE